MIDAYSKAVECTATVSGVFNVASKNYTVGEIGEIVHAMVEKHLNEKITLTKKNVVDFRNYMVSTEKAQHVLGFAPKQDVASIVNNLIENLNHFSDFSKPEFYNIEVFKSLKTDNILIR